MYFAEKKYLHGIFIYTLQLLHTYYHLVHSCLRFEFDHNLGLIPNKPGMVSIPAHQRCKSAWYWLQPRSPHLHTRDLRRPQEDNLRPQHGDIHQSEMTTYKRCCALFWMNAMMTKSTEFPRDTIWAKVITLLKIRFLGRDCISSSSSATRPATAARHHNAMLTTAFLWTCMVQRKHLNTSSLWSNMMLISHIKCLHRPSISVPCSIHRTLCINYCLQPFIFQVMFHVSYCFMSQLSVVYK